MFDTDSCDFDILDSSYQDDTDVPPEWEMGTTKLQRMSEEEERIAFVNMSAGDAKARDALIMAHLGLVRHIAKGYKNNFIGYEDLVQEGVIGLMRAIDLFDIERGCRLAPYAGFWIRSFMQQSAINARFIRLPSHVAKVMSSNKKQKEARKSRSHEKTDMPQVDSNSRSKKISTKTMEAAQLVNDWVKSLNISDNDMKPLDPEDETTLSPDMAYASEELNKFIHEAISGLTKKQRDVVVARYGIHGRDESTLDVIGRDMGISNEAVRQQQMRALDALRETFRQAGWSAMDCA